MTLSGVTIIDVDNDERRSRALEALLRGGDVGSFEKLHELAAAR